MSQRLVDALVGAARMVLVIGAVLVAIVPIAQTGIRGFCPEGTGPASEQGVDDAPAEDGSEDPAEDGEDPAEDGADPAEDGGSDPVDDGGDAPAGDDQDESSAGEVVLAAGVTAVRLATIVEPSEETSLPPEPPGTPDTAPAPGEDDAGTPPAAPVEEEPICGEGVNQCLPPLVGSVMRLGDDSCSSEAADRLRGALLPAFVVSSAMLAGAWVLRPRTGGGVFSRY